MILQFFVVVTKMLVVNESYYPTKRSSRRKFHKSSHPNGKDYLWNELLLTSGSDLARCGVSSTPIGFSRVACSTRLDWDANWQRELAQEINHLQWLYERRKRNLILRG